MESQCQCVVNDQCQIYAPWIELPCGARESGGVRCERTDPHGEDGHRISHHTVMHDLWGNGWTCGAIDRGIENLRTRH